MYKIKDFDADGLVEISLLCEENIDKEKTAKNITKCLYEF